MTTDHSSSTDYLASRFAATSARRKADNIGDDEDDEDILAELEAELDDESGPGMAALREKGLESLKQEIAKVKDMKESGYGRYDEITDEKEVIRTSAKEPRCVVHFYHSNFKRCAIMDRHLATIAPKYFSTLFIRAYVENVPWLVEKLGIKVLPCVICFVDGVSKDRIVGFEDLGNDDAFSTVTLELRLSQSGVLAKPTNDVIPTMYGTSSSSTFRVGGSAVRARSGGDDSDLDI